MDGWEEGGEGAPWGDRTGLSPEHERETAGERAITLVKAPQGSRRRRRRRRRRE